MEARHLVVAADSLDGGLGAAVMLEARYFVACGWQVVVAAPEAVSQFASSSEWPERAYVHFVDLPVPGATRNLIRGYSAMRRLQDILDGLQGFIVLHTHGLRTTLFSESLRLACPRIMTYHGGTVRSRLRRRVMSWQASRRALAVSASPRPPTGFTFLPHASPYLRGMPHQPRLPDPSRPLRVGWLGRLSPPKRPDMWIRALETALESGVQVEGHLVGDGPLAEGTIRLARRKGVPVTHYGALSTAQALDLMDVMLTWSDSDALTFSVQEAIWSGIPALSNALEGPASILGDCSIGLVNVSSVAQALRVVCEDAQAVTIEQQVALGSLLSPNDPMPIIHTAIEKLLATYCY